MSAHRLIVVASEQIWPNLYTIEWLASEPEGLASVDILHTNDEKHSRVPAARLEALLRKIHPEISVRKHKIAVDFGQIARTIDRIIEDHVLDPWTININGGTKLIAVGLTEAIDKVPARFIYRDIDSNWYQIQAKGRSRELSRIDVPEDRVNRLPMKELLALHFITKEQVEWNGQPPKELPVLQLFRLAAECEWNWKIAFKRCGIFDVQQESCGSLFEKVVGALVLKFRPASIWINAKAVTREKIVETELDVVAHTSGVMIYIDCKLGAYQGNADAMITQVRDAATALQSLGGKNARGILLRPNSEFDEVLRSYAESRNLIVVDRSNFHNFVKILAQVFRRKVPNELKEVDEFLQTVDQTSTAEAGNHQAPAFPNQKRGNRPFDLEKWFAEQLNSGDRTWAAAWCDANTLVIRHMDEVPTVRKETIKKVIQKYWREFGTCLVDFSNSNRSFTSTLHTNPMHRRKIETIFERWAPDFRWTEGLPPIPASQKPKRIVTHAGAAHADEVASILVALGSDPTIDAIDRVTRVKEADLKDPSVYVFDIGNQHDPRCLNFDHHQFSQDAQIRCTLTLVLEHFGLLHMARRYWPWLESFEKGDVLGIQAVSEMLGVSREIVDLLRQNPLERVFLNEFSRVTHVENGDPLFEAMVRFGASLLASLRECEAQEKRFRQLMRICEWTPGRRAVLFPNTRKIYPDTFSIITDLLIRETCPDAEVKIADDLRGEGLALIRLPNARGIDFSRIRGRDEIAFVHHTGFLAVTRELIPDDTLCELIRMAAAMSE